MSPLRSRPAHLVALLTAAATASAGLAAGTAAQAAGAASASSSAEAPVTTSVRASDDTYVTEYAPDRNSGAVTKIAASAQAGGRKTSYLKFTVSGVPEGVTPQAKLTLSSLQPLPANVRVSPVSSTGWRESTTTWRNRPAVGSVMQTLTPASSAKTLTFDVSQHITGNGTYALALTTTDSARNAAFGSDEAATGRPSLATTYTPPPRCTVSETLVPSCGAWWGVAPNPLGGESWDQALGNFEAQMGRPAGIAHYYHRDGQLFPTASEIARAREPGKNRLLYLNWKPATDRTWAQVAAGDATVNARIDKLSAHIKANYTEKFFLTIYHEPEDNVRATAGSGYTAADYRAMFRHTVNRLRANGVHNAVFVMNYMGIPRWGTEPWFETLYPGDDVVDWIAEDPYSFGNNPEWLAQFGGMVNRREARYPSWPGFYTWATTTHPSKPIMLGEWGVDEVESNAAFKPGFFDNALDEMERYPQVKAMVYWNQNEFNPVGKTRIDSSPASLAAYKRLSGAAYLNPDLP